MYQGPQVQTGLHRKSRRRQNCENYNRNTEPVFKKRDKDGSKEVGFSLSSGSSKWLEEAEGSFEGSVEFLDEKMQSVYFVLRNSGSPNLENWVQCGQKPWILV